MCGSTHLIPISGTQRSEELGNPDACPKDKVLEIKETKTAKALGCVCVSSGGGGVKLHSPVCVTRLSISYMRLY